MQSLPANPFIITTFLFFIGSESSDSLANNDLTLPDSTPFKISLPHLRVISQNGQFVLCDRRRTPGSIVDKIEEVERNVNSCPLFFKQERSILILDNQKSV